jgi:hypothetical protein
MADNEPNVTFVGRLANYRYFNMDQTVKNALELFDADVYAATDSGSAANADVDVNANVSDAHVNVNISADADASVGADDADAGVCDGGDISIGGNDGPGDTGSR